MDIHPGLLKMVNKMVEEATSPEIESDYIHTRLKNDILEQIKEHGLSRMYYTKFLEKMHSKDANVRNLTFQLIAPLVLQSRESLELFARDLYIFIDCIFGTQHALPEPLSTMNNLKNRFKEHIEILNSRLGKLYPQFAVCKEYIHDQIVKERRNEKRMRVEAIQVQPPPEKKRHSMELIQETVNHIIWELFDAMEVFEYEDDYDVQFDFTGIDYSKEEEGDDFFSHLMVNPVAVQEAQKQRESHWEERKRVFKKMHDNYDLLINELIPTLERNEILLQSRNTQKARIALEKIVDMLDRCRKTSTKCSRLLYRYKETYGEGLVF